MKIFDCFMYFNEDLVLDIRLNTLNKDVDKFVIVESKYTHSGEFKGFNFNLNNYKEFKDKIIYIKIDKLPSGIDNILESDISEVKRDKQLNNAMIVENFQRDCIQEGLILAEDEDFIFISDIDEIPNLKNLDLSNYKSKILLFKQFFFHYKLNLYLKDFYFFGSKGCFKKDFISPQWLRNIKSKKYGFWRFDTIFSKKKYNNIKIINNGGWHFTTILDAKGIIYKLKSYLHHADFPEDLLKENLFKSLITEKKIMYDHGADKKTNRFLNKKQLSEFEFELLPDYIRNNKEKFKDWMI